MGFKEIAAAEAAKLFASAKIAVQVAKRVIVKGEDGRKREQFETSSAPLAPEHVLSAKKYDDGRVTITTIDGKRYEASAK